VAANLSPSAKERAIASDLLRDIVGGVVDNGFALIDVTGKPTTWGRWSPTDVNGCATRLPSIISPLRSTISTLRSISKLSKCCAVLEGSVSNAVSAMQCQQCSVSNM
jgi:hypothetical protein